MPYCPECNSKLLQLKTSATQNFCNSKLLQLITFATQNFCNSKHLQLEMFATQTNAINMQRDIRLRGKQGATQKQRTKSLSISRYISLSINLYLLIHVYIYYDLSISLSINPGCKIDGNPKEYKIDGSPQGYKIKVQQGPLLDQYKSDTSPIQVQPVQYPAKSSQPPVTPNQPVSRILILLPLRSFC